MFRSLFASGKRKNKSKNVSHSTKRAKSLTARHLQIENLEERQLLSISPQILANQDPLHYQESGSNWAAWPDPNSYGQAFRYHAAGDGTDTASWTFDTLEAGKNFQLYATWTADGNRASDAPFTVLDGQTVVGTVKLNEQFAPINATFDNHGWESLGVYHTDTGILTIRLSDNANGYVIANAVGAMEVTAVTTPTTLVDNADAAYAETGSEWRGWSDTASYQGDFRYHVPGTGQNKATWTFEGLDPNKQYSVLTTWSADNNRATNSPFTVFDDTTSLATVSWSRES